MAEYITETYTSTEGVATPTPVVLVALPFDDRANAVAITNRYLDLDDPQPATATLVVRCTNLSDQAVAEYRIRAGDVYFVRYVTGPIQIWTLGEDVPFFAAQVQVGDTISDALAAMVGRLLPAARQGLSMVSYDPTSGDFDFAVIRGFAYVSDVGYRIPYTVPIAGAGTLVAVDHLLNPIEGVTATLVGNGTSEGYVQIDVSHSAFSPLEPPLTVSVRVYHQPNGGERTLIVSGKLRAR
jgi:hypothetical protein